MPQIVVNLGEVEAFEGLPVGTYLADIDSIKYEDPRQEGGAPSLRVTYVVVDEGEHLGRKQSEWVYLSAKSAFRLKKWFNKFGLGDVENLDINDETNELTEPDLVGSRVVFMVKADGVKPNTNPPETRYRTELVTVEDAPVQPTATATVRAAPVAQAKADAAVAEAPKQPQRRTLR